MCPAFVICSCLKYPIFIQLDWNTWCFYGVIRPTKTCFDNVETYILLFITWAIVSSRLRILKEYFHCKYLLQVRLQNYLLFHCPDFTATAFRKRIDSRAWSKWSCPQHLWCYVRFAAPVVINTLNFCCKRRDGSSVLGKSKIFYTSFGEATNIARARRSVRQIVSLQQLLAQLFYSNWTLACRRILPLLLCLTKVAKYAINGSRPQPSHKNKLTGQ